MKFPLRLIALAGLCCAFASSIAYGEERSAMSATGPRTVTFSQVVENPGQRYSWAGAYFGINLSYNSSSIEAKDSQIYPGAAWVWKIHNQPSSAVIGLYSGFNMELGNRMIIGTETGYERHLPFTDSRALSIEFAQKWSGFTRMRFGYSFDRFLPYISGGVAYSELQDLWPKLSVMPVLFGFTFGGGAEYALTQEVILRADYRMNRHQSFDYPQVTNMLALIGHQFSVGLAYKF